MKYAEMQLLQCSEDVSRVLPTQMTKLKISVAVEKGSSEVAIMIRWSDKSTVQMQDTCPSNKCKCCSKYLGSPNYNKQTSI
jgi:hypothetical protein